MKTIKYLIILSIAFLFTISSCTKDNLIVDKIDTNPVESKKTSSNPLVNRGTTNNDGLDMGCFTIIFPFELSVNGDNIPIDSDTDFDAIFNGISPDDSTFIDFVYPINITFNDTGDEKSISDGNKLGEAFAKCVPDSGWANDFPAFLINETNSCFQLNYPLDLVNNDSVKYSAIDEDRFIELVAEHDLLSFVFPISMTKIETQEVFIATDENSLFDLLISCDPIIDPDSIITPVFFGLQYACYTIGFPVNYFDQNNEFKSANDLDALVTAFMNYEVKDFALPIVLISQDSIIKIITTDAELDQAIADCGFPNIELDAELAAIYFFSHSSNCYKMVYPITITSDEGVTTSQLNDEDALNAEISNQISSNLIFPFSLFDIASNENKYFNNPEDVLNYISNCE